MEYIVGPPNIRFWLRRWITIRWTLPKKQKCRIQNMSLIFCISALSITVYKSVWFFFFFFLSNLSTIHELTCKQFAERVVSLALFYPGPPIFILFWSRPHKWVTKSQETEGDWLTAGRPILRMGVKSGLFHVFLR